MSKYLPARVEHLLTLLSGLVFKNIKLLINKRGYRSCIVFTFFSQPHRQEKKPKTAILHYFIILKCNILILSQQINATNLSIDTEQTSHNISVFRNTNQNSNNLQIAFHITAAQKYKTNTKWDLESSETFSSQPCVFAVPFAFPCIGNKVTTGKKSTMNLKNFA